MQRQDEELAHRVRDIIAVVTDDIDAVTCEVEEGVAYIEGVVSDERERRAISSAVRQLDGLAQVITCLATERVLPRAEHEESALYPAPVLMHYYSLS